MAFLKKHTKKSGSKPIEVKKDGKIQPRKDTSGVLPPKSSTNKKTEPTRERVEQMKLMVRGLLSRVPSRRLSDFLAENGIENYCRMRKSKLIGKATTVALKGLGVE